MSFSFEDWQEKGAEQKARADLQMVTLPPRDYSALVSQCNDLCKSIADYHRRHGQNLVRVTVEFDTPEASKMLAEWAGEIDNSDG